MTDLMSVIVPLPDMALLRMAPLAEKTSEGETIEAKDPLTPARRVRETGSATEGAIVLLVRMTGGDRARRVAQTGEDPTPA